MARKKLKAVKFGKCEVVIYRDAAWNEYVVQTKIDGKTQGGSEAGGYFTDNKTDARKTAAVTIRSMKLRPICRPGALAGARTSRKVKKAKKRAKSKQARKRPW